MKLCAEPIINSNGKLWRIIIGITTGALMALASIAWAFAQYTTGQFEKLNQQTQINCVEIARLAATDKAIQESLTRIETDIRAIRDKVGVRP